MILKRRVALNGVWLDELDERIIISGIDEAAGKDTIRNTASAFGDGSRVTGKRRDTVDIAVKFAMNIKNGDMEARSLLLERVIAWAAAGGWLTLNYRPNRQIYVMLAQAPGEGDLYNWINEYTITFRAYSVPYWMDVNVTQVASGIASSGSLGIVLPGSARSVADVIVENKSGKTIQTVNLTINGNGMSFNSLGLGGSSALTIEHVHTDRLFYFRARIGGASVMNKRSGANDFYLNPGYNAISFSSERAVRVTVSARGRYL